MGTTSDAMYKGVDSARKEGKICIQKLCACRAANVDRERDLARRPWLESFVVVSLYFLLLSSVFGSLMRFTDSHPRVEAPSFVLQCGWFSGGVELGEDTKFNGP